MGRRQVPDPRLTSWREVQAKITKAWFTRNYEAAFAQIDSILNSDYGHVGEVLVLRGMIRESMSDLVGAREDWLKALDVSSGDYTRYVAQRHIAATCAAQGSPDEARMWYREALRTAVGGEGISAGIALEGFLDLCETPLLADDLALAESAARKSWQARQLEGEPDLLDLKSVARRLKDSR